MGSLSATSVRDLPTQLALRFHALAELLHTDAGPHDGLDRLVALAVEVVPRCDWASVVQLSGRRRVGCLAHAGSPAMHADELQVTAGCGPAVDAARHGGVVAATDVTADHRWPEIGPALAAQTELRSVLSFRLAAEPASSALSFYGRDAAPFPAETLETAALFATHARTYLMHLEAARKAANLADALITSRTIGSAIGIVMLAQRISSEQAFGLLRDASQRLHVKVRDLAEEILRTGTLPSMPRHMTSVPTPVAAAG